MRTHLCILGLAVVLCGSGPAGAEGSDEGLEVVPIPAQQIAGGPGGNLGFAAQFLCTLPPQPLAPPQTPLAPGNYRTLLSIYNPNLVPVAFTLKATLTTQQSGPRGPVGPPTPETLDPNEGRELDCERIEALAGVACIPEGCFLRGFVTITTSRELTVVVVYTLKAP